MRQFKELWKDTIKGISGGNSDNARYWFEKGVYEATQKPTPSGQAELTGYVKFTLWENGFSWGVKCGDEIVSYDICCHLPNIPDKETFAKAMIAKMNT